MEFSARKVGPKVAVQLSADSEIRLLAEEILAEVDIARFGLRDIGEIEAGDVEHLAGALSVAGSDERGVDIDKAALLEVLMDRVGDQGADTECCLEHVGAGAEMRDGAQILHGVALFLKRVIGSAGALDGDLGCLDLERLLCLGRSDQCAADHQGCADLDFRDLGEVRHVVVVDDLQLVKVSSVADHQEAEGLGVTV